MRTNQREREDFLLAMEREGVPADVARKVMRHATTIQRLAAAECNEDYPYDVDRPDNHVCTKCETGFRNGHVHKSTGLCVGCHAEMQIADLLFPFKVGVVTSGDPRGACVKLKVPSGRTDDWGQTGICVPTPNY